MKLLNSFGPNPRLVRMFAIEKGIELPAEDLDLLAGDNRAEPYLAKNPGGQMPALELDDGTVIAETVTICEYLEETQPLPALIGTNALERANTRMWVRRVELNITEHMYNAFRYAEGIDIFRNRMVVLPEAADGLKKKARAGREWLDGLIGSRDYVAGEKFSLADIVLFCCMDFCKDVGQPLDADLANLQAWYARMNARPSAGASLHGAAANLKMAG
ncbi:MAG: glutathione S-transferase family protein [Gammaproteobacteria bacterium]